MLSVMLYKYNPDDVDPPLLSLHRARVFKGGKKEGRVNTEKEDEAPKS